MGNVHYVREGSMLVPAGMTEFAKDQTFGYRASDLTEYVEEKTAGTYRKESCICITLEELQNRETERILEKLLSAERFDKIIVNAVSYEDLKIFCAVYMDAVKAGKRYLARTAAAFPKVLGGIADQPLLGRKELRKEEKNGGIVLIGSHVNKTTRQLECLMEGKAELESMEFDVSMQSVPGGLQKEAERVTEWADSVIGSGKTAVIYTSRRVMAPDTEDKDQILEASVRISDAVTSVIDGCR